MREDFKLQSNDGKNLLSVYVWNPEGKPKAVLQLCHGMVEYLERYDEFAQFLCSKGIAVIGHDQLGHGYTAANKEDLGYFAEKKGKGLLLTDLHLITEAAKKKWPGTPVFMLGHSMGSFELRRYITIWGNELSGAIIMGTGSQPLSAALFGKFIAFLIWHFKGSRYRSRFIYNIANGAYDKQFKNNGSWLSKNEDSVKAYKSDEKCGFIFTVSAYHTLFSLLEDLALKKNNNRIPKKLPILFVSGMNDPVGNYTKGVLTAYNELVAQNLKDIDIKFYKDDRHELLQELDRNDVFDDLYHFIEKRI